MAANASAPSSSSKTAHTTDTFRPLLKQLILSQPLPIPNISSSSSSTARPLAPALSSSELDSLFDHLSDPAFTSNPAHHAQLGACLTGLRLGGVDAQAETLAIASQRFLGKCIEVDSTDEESWRLRREELQRRLREEGGWEESGLLSEAYKGTVDLVGTGGDGQDTFNVSTTAAIVASGVPGVRVCKHGAKASSSTSGSADLLLSLGIPLLSLTPSIISTLLPTSSFVFLFAQLFHPALAPLGPIRRALGHPTIFNVLGPLINPARPARCILGVHSPYLGEIFAEALKRRGCERAWIVCGKEGLDEISIEGETDVWELDAGTIKHFVVSPLESFGIPAHPLKSVASYTSAENAAVVLHMVQPGQEASVSASTAPLSEPLAVQLASASAGDEVTRALLSGSQSLPAIPAGADIRALMDYTLLQASALLYVGGYAHSLKDAVALARKSLNGGGALRSLEAFRREATKEVQMAAAAVNSA
ncbi:hypothetical protein BCV69DRAFT_283813 [Microstroma glucosiphilum]|uniref:Glycosyl transferase family 3 domain-containing protein n=1 Tax=Pseudomicrostroma glucosiphilum TaxID=1684307 RepID=A0A316U377_9BASI|nr:hypothetical protein BCV69DRAFT_283813 [Pseudomicrostroma glucosiphilum]PWN19707.1 hypothetical protein BCV69DRAFT_283813 [Pseudomicrostroma glucosiphilum]